MVEQETPTPCPSLLNTSVRVILQSFHKTLLAKDSFLITIYNSLNDVYKAVILEMRVCLRYNTYTGPDFCSIHEVYRERTPTPNPVVVRAVFRPHMDA